jgi:hypothetical protein
MTLFLLSIWCAGREFIDAIDSIRHTVAVTQYSVMISRSTGTLFSLTIYGSAVTQRFWQFHASAMTLFLLLIWCVGREFIDAVDSIRQLSLSIHWRFQGLQGLYFRWRFLVNSDAVFTVDCMSLPWLCFLYWFHASTVN